MKSIYQRTYTLKSDYPIHDAMTKFQSYIDTYCPHPVKLRMVGECSFQFYTNQGLDNHLTALLMLISYLKDNGVMVTEFYYDEIRTEQQDLMKAMEL